MSKLKQKAMRLVYHISMPMSMFALHNSNRSRVLLIAEDQILLERSYIGSQAWSLPGGGVKKKEPLDQAASRELEEEIGIKLEPSVLRSLGAKRLPTGVGFTKANIHFFTHQLPKTQEIHISHPLEIIEAGWWPINALPSNLNPVVKTALDLISSIDK